jgi:hypothetical protein
VALKDFSGHGGERRGLIVIKKFRLSAALDLVGFSCTPATYQNSRLPFAWETETLLSRQSENTASLVKSPFTCSGIDSALNNYTRILIEAYQ